MDNKVIHQQHVEQPLCDPSFPANLYTLQKLLQQDKAKEVTQMTGSEKLFFLGWSKALISLLIFQNRNIHVTQLFVL